MPRPRGSHVKAADNDVRARESCGRVVGRTAHGCWKPLSKKASAPPQHVTSKRAGEQHGQGRVHRAECSCHERLVAPRESSFANRAQVCNSSNARAYVTGVKFARMVEEWCGSPHTVGISIEKHDP